ncbi:hypothetical protein EfaeDRAFT_1527 [Enterococcus faecium DO]|nr:hypothetical protein EfaeDRAFT_1527 [Enterococcus faecium DO]
MPTSQSFPKSDSHAHNIDVNVVYGKIKQVKEGSFGSLTVLMTGETKELDQAEVFIKEQGVGIEVIHRG